MLKRVAIVSVLVLASLGAFAGIAAADPPAPPTEPKTTIDSDGTYSVGTDIVPGTYRSAGPVDDGTCYWKRLGGVDGSDIIDNAMTKKPQVVQIHPGDTAFKTNDCLSWQMAEPGSADGNAPGDMPPWIAGAQFQVYMAILNGYARQFDEGQLPR